MGKNKKNEVTIRSSAAEYLTFVAATGDDKNSVEVRYEDENIWITQKMMATLYEVDVRTINYHILKIFEDSELQQDSVIRNFRITAADGKSYDTKHYSLQMIIAVGFKVNSARAVQFRKWINQIAKDYTIKGWVLDSDRLKNGGSILTKEHARAVCSDRHKSRNVVCRHKPYMVCAKRELNIDYGNNLCGVGNFLKSDIVKHPLIQLFSLKKSAVFVVAVAVDVSCRCAHNDTNVIVAVLARL